MTVDKMPVELDNEIALVRLAQSGSTESFGILVSRYERRVYRLVRAIIKSDQDAEDLLQEIFLKAYANIHRFKGESRFYTWLAGIAMKDTLLKLHPREVHDWSPFEEPANHGDSLSLPGEIRGWLDNPEGTYSKPELSAILSKGLQDLEIQLRAVFALRDIEGFSLEETSRVLGLPLAVVATRLARARLKLRQDLSAWFENPSGPAIEQGECEAVRHFLSPAPTGDRECP